MEKLYYENLDEAIYYKKLTNGLRVYILHKEDFQKTFATFTTEYGSIDNTYKVNDMLHELPDGIAHFLEHKMFEEEDVDVFQKFASQGAQTNAFTSFNRTTYLFSATENLNENIETLLNFVQNPFFTEENVEKEKGIIAQEIKMYEDNPDWRVYFDLIRGLYTKHPIRIDIAGTVDSIYQITKDQLYTCYETFYHPNNMLLFIFTRENPNDILKLVENNQEAKDFIEKPIIERIYPDESEKINKKNNYISLAIAIPKFLVGFKDVVINSVGDEFIKQEVSTKILLEMIFGKSSNLYEDLFNQGLIDEDFDFDYQIEKGYAFTIIGGNSNNPDEVINMVKNEIKKVRANGLEMQMYDRIKKKQIGEYLRKLNSPEFIANQFTRYIFNGSNLFNVIPVIEKITFDDITARFNHLSEDKMATSIVKGIE